MPLVRPALASLALAAATLLAPRAADAFCGFYVTGGDAKLYNNATVVAMMRDGTRTVLSMQNNYQGPPADFAMVVPVPVILKEQDVKTLPRGIFDRIDQLAAPRLVEYWEEDPCAPEVEYRRLMRGGGGLDTGAVVESDSPGDFGVKVEAKFSVGEYDIVILSAQEATGLDAWLRANKYTIPDGAAEVLRPYVQAGMKFFVAKVDVKKIAFDAKGQAMLSPLRFHYDSETFNLPVRLGLLNSSGAQDLLVHVIARSRYELANYPNATIPTNLEVKDATRDAFGQFYVSLFDATLAQHPKAVVTEYAWQANNCDPCPVDPLSAEELMTLGADVLPSVGKVDASRAWSLPGEFVLTRMHARYARDSLGEDLVFREAKPIVGGRESPAASGKGVEQGASASDGVNNFQARYIIRHPWTGKVACQTPRWGRWGGPPGGVKPGPAVARDLAFTDRSASLATYVAQDVPELKLAIAVNGDRAPLPETPPPTPPTPPDVAAAAKTQPDAKAEAKAATKPDAKADAKANGCGCAASPPSSGLLALGLVALVRRRRRG
jgi:MYXO-CTERM domain-containing protein